MNLPACFRVVRGWRPLEVAPLVVDTLRWEQPSIRVYGRNVRVPRLTSWMGDVAYTYSGHRHEPAPMPRWVTAARMDLQALLGARFNAVLANWYRDGRDSVAWHADDERELGVDPVIASWSLGAPRGFLVRSRATDEIWRIALGDGDLLIMSGEAQRLYQHSVPKTARPVGPRMNLSFRLVAR